MSFFHAERGTPFVSTRGFAPLSPPKASLVKRKKRHTGSMIKGGAHFQCDVIVIALSPRGANPIRSPHR
ncbi:hypothetical protein AB4620_23310, partial [Vibrio cyclitrophicus]